MHFIFLTVFSCFTLLLGDTAAAPTWGTEIFVVKEKYLNPNILQQYVVEISDPSHARYGQYLSAAKIRNIVTPLD
ncbi:hypothetical protein D6D19_09157 [Aureobasidium pullulans]|uniref:Peptidase S53 activation domain-containing protein n=1 Tax=Aureobasidium pullulans TaxID=5580 RepID=A0A4V4IPT2_AURPU|nr:hypothetical protein D6D19_09157 [Aureobasidium pullulans]